MLNILRITRILVLFTLSVHTVRMVLGFPHFELKQMLRNVMDEKATGRALRDTVSVLFAFVTLGPAILLRGLYEEIGQIFRVICNVKLVVTVKAAETGDTVDDEGEEDAEAAA